MERSECYAILGLTAGASLAELKTAYRQLAKQWHPDRFAQDPEKLKQATTQFQRINEAYEILRLQGETRSTPPAFRTKTTRTKTGYRATTTDPEFYYWAAQKAVNLNAPQEAIDALTQAIRLKPDYLKAYQFRAFLHEQLGHQHQAAADFRKVAELQLHQTTATRTASRPDPEPSSKPPTQAPPAFTLLTQLSGYLRSLALHPKGVLIATADNSKQVLLWHREQQAWFKRLDGHQHIVNAVAWHPRGTMLASADSDGQIRLWNGLYGKQLNILEGHRDRVLSLTWSRDGQVLVSGSRDCTVQLWNLQQKSQKTLKGYGKAVTALAMHPYQGYFASGGLEPLIRLRHSQTGKLIRSLRSNGGTLSLAFHPQGQLLASGGYDAVGYLWDLENRTEPRRLEGHDDRISAIVFNATGQLMATGSWDATIRIWQMPMGTLITTLIGHEDVVSGLAFTPRGDRLISSSWDGTLRSWRVERG